jgi:predicted heme/steroid binding protein
MDKNNNAQRISKTTGTKFGMTLVTQSQLTGWPTATVRDHKDTGKNLSNSNTRKDGKSRLDTVPRVATLTGWSSPTASTGGPSKNPDNPRGANAGNPLATSATLTGWPTATVRDHKDTGKNLSNSNTRKDGKSRLHSVPRVATLTGPARLTATGEMQIGSGAEIKNGGQLNPALSRWLMGLPPEWCDSAVTATPSSRPRRKHS